MSVLGVVGWERERERCKRKIVRKKGGKILTQMTTKKLLKESQLWFIFCFIVFVILSDRVSLRVFSSPWHDRKKIIIFFVRGEKILIINFELLNIFFFLQYFFRLYKNFSFFCHKNNPNNKFLFQIFFSVINSADYHSYFTYHFKLKETESKSNQKKT